MQLQLFGDSAVSCACGAPGCTGVLGRAAGVLEAADSPVVEPGPELELMMGAMEEPGFVPVRPRPQGW